MKFLNSIPFKVKFFTLLLVAALGFGLISFVSYNNTNSLKDKLDYTYFGNFVPILKLKDIIFELESNISHTIYKNEHSIYSNAYAYKILKLSNEKIQEHWKSYKSIYKSENELAYINYVDKKLRDISIKIKSVYVRDSIKQINITSYQNSIKELQRLIQKLISYELKVAQVTRKEVTLLHQTAVNKIFSIAIASTVIAFIIFIPLLRNIEFNQKRLEKLTLKLKNISIKDPMTKLYNRRYFDHVFKKTLLNAARYQKNITFMMLDIDFFKQYNDTYGHQAGDETIITVARVLEANVKRASDYAFRLGGEEFAVLLYDVDTEFSLKIAEMIRQSVEQSHIPHEKNKVSKYVTVSIGVVCQTIDKSSLNDESSESIIQLSDEKLYKAKESGRNRVMM